MGRRSDHSRNELYELALTAARRIIEDDGHHALTARNVADEMGYSPGTLYNLFENLDDLIVHLNGRLLDELYDELDDTPLSGIPEQDLRRLLNRYLAFVDARANLWALLLEHSLPAGQEVPAWYHRKVDKVLSVLESALAPAFSPHGNDGPRRSARVLWASLHGIWSLAKSGKLKLLTSESTPQLAETLASHYLAGIAALREKSDG